jgi:hypothetical protein
MDIEKSYKIYKKALRDGTLKRKDVCEHCGELEKQIYGHHEDYNKPTDVIWLCGLCHKKRHITKDLNKHKHFPSNARDILGTDFTASYVLELFSWSKRGLLKYWHDNGIDFYCDGYEFFLTEDGFDQFLRTFTERNYDD